MKVEHDEKKQKFWVPLGSYQAELMYAKKGKVLDFYHIYVPDPFRNRGIAGKILIGAFEYAKKQGYRVVPSCPFIAHDFLPRFPEYQEVCRAGLFPFTKVNLESE
jgi:hypothetical protein